MFLSSKLYRELSYVMLCYIMFGEVCLGNVEPTQVYDKARKKSAIDE